MTCFISRATDKAIRYDIRMIPETPLPALQQNMFLANPKGMKRIRELSRREFEDSAGKSTRVRKDSN